LRVLSTGNSQAALALEAVYHVVSTLAVLLLWRGLWGLSQSFVLVGERGVKVAWMFHCLGFLVMLILQVKFMNSNDNTCREREELNVLLNVILIKRTELCGTN